MTRKALWFALLIGLLPASRADDAAAAADQQVIAPAGQILVMVRIAPPHFRPDAEYGGGYARTGEQARRRIAADIARVHDLTLSGEWPMPDIGVDCFVMQVPQGQSAAAVAQAVSHERGVEWAQPVQLFRGLDHNDPLFPLQPAATRWQLADLHAAVTGRDVVVALLDSGVELEHPDLAGQIAVVENFVDRSPYAAEAHGTAVAGIIAALADNRMGIAGIAPRSRLMALRACWQPAGTVARCSSFTLAKALQFALERNAQVINLSLAGPQDELLQRLLAAAYARDITVVAAADPGPYGLEFPASDRHVVAVASDEAEVAAAIAAPGRDIPTTLPGSRWGFVTGSSFAAAQVSGLVALLREASPTIRPRQVREALGAVAGPRRAGGRPEGIDACATVSKVARACVCYCPKLDGSPTVDYH